MEKSQTGSLVDEELGQLHEQLLAFHQKLKLEIQKVIVGQEQVLDLLVIALFCNGHVLLTGVPGLAKTLLIKTLSSLFHLNFNRIQCTPDLMPSDIIGGDILEESAETGKRYLRFVQGPIFTNLLLADEINRTSPRTQSALLQAMQERQVTVAGNTNILPPPFIVFATQNPIDSEGTYPLPEAQLDRFLFNVDIRYPPFEEEILIAQRSVVESKTGLSPIFEPEQLLKLQRLITSVPISESLVKWIVQLVRSTRPHESKFDFVQKYVDWGAGVRASQNIVTAAKAKAILSGQNIVNSGHIRAVIPPILRHRVILNFIGEAEKWTADQIVEQLLEHHRTLIG
jgi:MoxR-like ATPase